MTSKVHERKEPPAVFRKIPKNAADYDLSQAQIFRKSGAARVMILGEDCFLEFKRNEKPVKVHGKIGDILCESLDDGRRFFVQPKDFIERYEEITKTLFQFAPVSDDEKGHEQAWFDVEAALTTVRGRLDQLNDVRGHCDATRQARIKVIEAIYWLNERMSVAEQVISPPGGTDD